MPARVRRAISIFYGTRLTIASGCRAKRGSCEYTVKIYIATTTRRTFKSLCINVGYGIKLGYASLSQKYKKYIFEENDPA